MNFAIAFFSILGLAVPAHAEWVKLRTNPDGMTMWVEPSRIEIDLIDRILKLPLSVVHRDEGVKFETHADLVIDCRQNTVTSLDLVSIWSDGKTVPITKEHHRRLGDYFVLMIAQKSDRERHKSKQGFAVVCEKFLASGPTS